MISVTVQLWKLNNDYDYMLKHKTMIIITNTIVITLEKKIIVDQYLHTFFLPTPLCLHHMYMHCTHD